MLGRIQIIPAKQPNSDVYQHIWKHSLDVLVVLLVLGLVVLLVLVIRVVGGVVLQQ